MPDRILAVASFSLAVTLFLARYAIAMWYRGPNPTVWSRENFQSYLDAVGMLPWLLAGAFFLLGTYFLGVPRQRNRDE